MRGLFLTLLMAIGPVALAGGHTLTHGMERSHPDPVYVISRFGNDSWSGRLAEPNAVGMDGPFATLERARDAMRADSEVDTTYVREGTYYLSNTLVLNSQDAGVTFAAYPGESPVISGGELVTGFLHDGGGLYSAALSQPSGLDLTIGGERLRVATSGEFDPNNPYTSDWFFADAISGTGSKTEFSFQPGDLSPSDFYEGILAQVTSSSRWQDDIREVESINFNNNTITLAEAARNSMGDGSTYRLLNHDEFISGTGEFGWDPESGRLVIMPENPDSLLSEGAVVARLDTLFQLNNADGVQILGLTFSDVPYDGEARVSWSRFKPSLELNDTDNATIAYNTFKNVGLALQLDNSSDNTIIGNEVASTGHHGIYLRDDSDRNLVSENYIHDIGVIRLQSHGIYARDASFNIFNYNLIDNVSRRGIDFHSEYNFGNVIEYNSVLHTNLQTADSGAIAFYGNHNDVNTNTIVRYNYIDDTGGLRTNSNHQWFQDWQSSGIYLDDQFSGVEIYGNFIIDTHNASIFPHGGKNVTITNNVVVLQDDILTHRGSTQQEYFIKLQPINGTNMNNIEWSNNIIYAPEGLTAGRDGHYWLINSGPVPTVTQNLLFKVLKYNGPANGTPDAGSIIANPLFVDPNNGDYSLQPNSPAFDLGFQELPYDEMGPDAARSHNPY